MRQMAPRGLDTAGSHFSLPGGCRSEDGRQQGLVPRSGSWVRLQTAESQALPVSPKTEPVCDGFSVSCSRCFGTCGETHSVCSTMGLLWNMLCRSEHRSHVCVRGSEANFILLCKKQNKTKRQTEKPVLFLKSPLANCIK